MHKQILTLLLCLSLMFVLAGCGGSSENETPEETKELAQQADQYYTEAMDLIQNIGDPSNLEATQSSLNDLSVKIGDSLSKIPEDTDDEALQKIRKVLETDENIVMAAYSTIATNDASGAELVQQYVDEYAQVRPEIDPYME